MQENKIIDIEKRGKWTIIIGVSVIILLMISVFCNLFGFLAISEKGSFGDTFSGIASPIANLIGAVLVFWALKSQIEANSIVMEANKKFQKIERNKMVLDHIYRLEEKSSYMLNDYNMIYARNGLYDFFGKDNSKQYLGNIMYYLSEIIMTVKMIEETDEDKDFFYYKFYNLMQNKYQEMLMDIGMMLDKYEKEKKVEVAYNGYIGGIKVMTRKIYSLYGKMGDVFEQDYQPPKSD